MSRVGGILRDSSLYGVLEMAVSFAGNVAIARLILPAEFGMFVVPMLLVAVAQALAESGMSSALVAKGREGVSNWRPVHSALLTRGLIGSVVLAGGYLLISVVLGLPPERAWFLLPMLPLYCISVVPRVALATHFRFAALGKITVGAAVLSSLFGVAVALKIRTVEALFLQRIFALAITALALLATRGIRLDFASYALPAALQKFGRRVRDSNLLEVVYNELDRAVVVLSSGPTQGGLYSRAKSVASIPAGMPGKLLLQPIYAVLGNTTATERGKVFLECAFVINILVIPPFCVLAAHSGYLFEVVYGPEWSPSASLFALFILAAVFHVAKTSLIYYCYSIGSPATVLRLSMVHRALQLMLVVPLLYGWILGALGLLVGLKIVEYAHYLHASTKLESTGRAGSFWSQHASGILFGGLVGGLVVVAGRFALGLLPGQDLVIVAASLLVAAAINGLVFRSRIVEVARIIA